MSDQGPPPYGWRAGVGLLYPDTPESAPTMPPPPPPIPFIPFGVPIGYPPYGYPYHAPPGYGPPIFHPWHPTPPSPSPSNDDGPGGDPAIPGTTMPDGLPTGAAILYGPSCTLNCFKRVTDPNQSQPRSGGRPPFNIYKADEMHTAQMVMTALGGGEGWALTEWDELGGGRWSVNTRVKWADERATKPIKELGWTEKRGKEKPPVWVTCHKMLS